MSEKGLYKKIKNWAYKTYGEYDADKDSGLLKIVKLSMLGMYGEAGWQDMMIMIKDLKRYGHTILIELKNPDGTGVVSDPQRRKYRKALGLGFAAYVTDDFDEACEVIRLHVEYAQGKVPAARWKAGPGGILE